MLRTVKMMAGLLCLVIHAHTQPVPLFKPSMKQVSDIPLPAGFVRVPVTEKSFAGFLRNLPLRLNPTVYLYNHQPKANQQLHYAVINISTGEKDLQQCADAIMRMRAEYFYGRQQYDSIRFLKNQKEYFVFSSYMHTHAGERRNMFMQFMEQVFVHCGTYSLEQQLKRVSNFSDMQVGDVLIKGGAPGHAELVVDMAINPETGAKIYLLAEGYMPAQDIHVLLNTHNPALGPWHMVTGERTVVTASWVFLASQLRKW